MHTADLAFIGWRFSQAFLQKNIPSKWWIASKVEAWNFTTKLSIK